MIQGIVFDLDDTLYKQQAPFASAINDLFPTFPESKMNALFIRFRYYSDLHYMKSITGEWSLAKMRYERIRLALADFDFVPSKSELETFQAAYDHALKTITLPSEISDSLTFLNQQDVPLGLITNGPVLRQKEKISALQLARWIAPEKMIISDAVGIKKPEPKIFSLMETRLNLAPESLLYIGDSFENDVIGAKAAGWSVWWFNHQNRKIPEGQSAIFEKEIKNFEDLKSLLTNQKSMPH